MLGNADSVMNLIIDETGRAKKAQVGVDLTLNKVSAIGLEWTPGLVVSDDTDKKEGRIATYTEVNAYPIPQCKNPVYSLSAGIYSIEFEQGLKPLPANKTAMIVNRSTLARSGALIRSSIYDPGFTTPKMGAILYVFVPIQIEQFARVAQIVIMDNEEAALYDGTYQGAKDKR